MSDRKEDFSFSFSSDQYNLKPSTEDNFQDNNYSWSDDGPKVLTTMRNMFAEEKSDEYELVYHNFSEEEQLKILNQMKQQKRRQVIQPQNFQRLHPPGPPRIQNRPTSSHQNPQTFQSPNSRNFQNFAPPSQAVGTTGPSEIDDDDDHEEEEDHDQDEDDYVEDFLQNRIVHHCPECSKKYTSERRLKHHIQVHKNADAYKCPKCGYCYQSPDSLRRHWKKTPNCDEVPVQRPIKSEVVDLNSSN